MKYHVLLDGHHAEVEIERDGSGFSVGLGDQTWHVDVGVLRDGHAYSLLIDDRSVDVGVEEEGDGLDLLIAGRRYSTEVLGEREWLARSIKGETEDGEKTVVAAMSGILRGVHVKEGQAIEKGQPLFILEAMKMENEVLAEVSGTVRRVAFEEGQTVNLGDVVVEID